MRSKIITRGDFLKGTAYATFGVAFGLRGIESLAKTPEKAVLTKSESKMIQIPGGRCVFRKHPAPRYDFIRHLILILSGAPFRRNPAFFGRE